MSPRSYATAQAFKRALEDRLRATAAQQGLPLDRLRQRLIFERFLVRTFEVLGESVLLKGGVVLELRLTRCRATQDVDLRCMGNPSPLLEQLQKAGRLNMGDFLSFDVKLHPRGGLIEGDGIIYEGRRFQAQAYLDGKVYGRLFGVDAGFGDALAGTPDTLEGSGLLAFVGIPPARLRAYPRETHIAEKLHAYTVPRHRQNSRIKDLPDLALLGQTGPFDRDTLRAALQSTFDFRGTHLLPTALPVPPASWAGRYEEQMAQPFKLPWPTLTVVHQAASAFLDPVLGGTAGPTWDPHRWAWN